MKIIADTSVWSHFLRRREPQESLKVVLFRQAIREQRIQMLGIIRQELLSGIKDVVQFKKVSEILEGFPDLLATSEDHTLAAEFFNNCRANGVQGSPVDFLICAQAHRNGMKILAHDNDYLHYADHIPLEFMSVE